MPGLRPFRKEALDLLAPSLAGELLQRALHVSAAIEDEQPRVLALGAIAGHLAGNGKEEALQYALSSALQIGMAYPRAKALAELAYVLSGADKEQALMEGLQAARYSDMFSDLALAKLAPHLMGEFVGRGLEVARHLGIRSLAAMASRLSGDAKHELVGEVLDALQNIDESNRRGEVLLRLAPSLDGEVLDRAWIAARKLDASETKLEFLLAIARRLSGHERALALSEGQEVAKSIVDPTARVGALVQLADELTEDGKEQAISDALTAIVKINEDGAHAKALAALAPMLSGMKRLDALGLALGLLERTDGWRRAELLRLLVPQLDGELLDRAARLAEGIADAKDRASALSFVAARLILEAKDSGTRTSALQRVGTWMFSVREIPRPQFLYFCTESIFKSQVLSQSALTEIAQCIREISEEWHFEPAV
jgi:hypothetical protein